jgi:predicted HicB family RNase H-like nuclease
MAKTVSLSGDDLTPTKVRQESAARQRGVVPSAEFVPMQFRMSPEFARAYKQAALDHGMKLNELLKECFDVFMKESK